MPDGWRQKGPDEAGLPEKKQQQQASKSSCFCIALRCTMTWMAVNIQRHREKKKNLLIPVLESGSWQEPLGPVGQKPPDSYHKRFGCQILITWKSFDQPHEDMMGAPTFSLSLSLFQGQLNSFFSASSFFISGSSLIAAHMKKKKKRETNSEQVRSLPVGSEWSWYNNQSDCHWVIKGIPPYKSRVETCKRISVGTSSTHCILQRCQVQTRS